MAVLSQKVVGLFLIQGPHSPSSRYRVLQFLPFLEEHGISCEVRPFPTSIFERIRVLKQLRRFDFVFIQRKRMDACSAWLMRRQSVALAFDFDDAIMFRNSQAATPRSSSRQRRFVRSVRAADVVFCGNSYIRDIAAPHNANTVSMPTVIDTERYLQKQYEKADTITLGWIGSRSTLPYLERLRHVFEEIGRRRDDIRLKIVSDSFFDLQHMRVQKVPWSNDTEVAEVQSFDIGLMPLTDDVWSRGKCSLKLLQCQAAGVPVVASPVGVNKVVVRENRTGFQATTHDEWIEKLLRLADDPDARERMGRAGRRQVIESFSVQKQVPVLLKYLRNLTKPARAPLSEGG